MCMIVEEYVAAPRVDSESVRVWDTVEGTHLPFGVLSLVPLRRHPELL